MRRPQQGTVLYLSNTPPRLRQVTSHLDSIVSVDDGSAVSRTQTMAVLDTELNTYTLLVVTPPDH